MIAGIQNLQKTLKTQNKKTIQLLQWVKGRRTAQPKWHTDGKQAYEERQHHTPFRDWKSERGEMPYLHPADAQRELE